MKTMINVKLILNGMERLAFLASSPEIENKKKIHYQTQNVGLQQYSQPVEAIESKPTKAKKHLAAPAITPAKP